MISFNEAYERILGQVRPMETENIPLARSLGRILAEDILSDMDMPPFNKAAMDGFACRKQDLDDVMKVVEEIPAGVTPTKTIGPGECASIMTGSVVPEGADCVIMVEDTEKVSADTVRYLKEGTKDNICYTGEDIKTGDQVLSKGDRIDPQHIAVLAAVGCANPPVAKQPRVGIISTGSELVEPGEKAGGAKIRNSNGYQLAAQAEAFGCLTENYGIAEDTEEALDAVIRKAAAENDVILLSGGVSMGEYDLVPGVLQNNGIELQVTRIAIKPGRPCTFGISDDVVCFALPGNPVSSFMQFELLAKPYLLGMMGHAHKPVTVRARFSNDLKMKPGPRLSVLPVRFTEPGYIERVSYHGSAHINAICGTDGVIMCPPDGGPYHEGDEIDVRLL